MIEIDLCEERIALESDHEVVGATKLFHFECCRHRVHANDFMRLLTIRARGCRGEHDVFARHEGEFSVEVCSDGRFPHDKTFCDIRHDVERAVESQKRFG